MNKYIFEFQTKFQALYTFNLLDIRYFRFDDNKKELLLNFGDYDHYSIDESTYDELKNNLINLANNLNYIFDENRYIFLDHILSVAMYNKGYFLMFKMNGRFFRISKDSYYTVLKFLKEKC